MSRPSRFVWYELMTSNASAAAGFYGQVLGWRTKDSGIPGMDYTVATAGEHMVGGIMPIPPEASAMGAGPCWTGYIGVENLDDTVRRITDAGGKTLRPAQDIPTVGRFAVVADPHGAAFIAFQPQSEPPATQPPPDAPGLVSWHELHAGDVTADLTFYQTLFGWAKADAMDMGPEGVYQMFSIDGNVAGGMMRKGAHMPAPCWMFYFNVDSIDAAIDRVKTGGGKISNGPIQVPGGTWIANCEDPQGAWFSIHAKQR